MKTDDKLLTHLEDLSNFRLTDDEKSRFAKDFQEIINSTAILNTLDTGDIAECSHPLDYINVFREDEPGEPFGRDLILQNAPRHNNEMFIAPRTVGD